MKKMWIVIAILIILISIVLAVSINSKSYLDENTLNYIMNDYNYVTGNTEEITRKYFLDLKSNETSYSIDTLKSMEIYDTEPEKIVLNIQVNYIKLIDNIPAETKEQLDKYLLENSLKYYYKELNKN